MGIFRGGNKNKAFQVKQEHLDRLAKIFTDSENEMEEEVKVKPIKPLIANNKAAEKKFVNPSLAPGEKAPEFFKFGGKIISTQGGPPMPSEKQSSNNMFKFT